MARNDAADRWLTVLVGSAVAAGGACVVWAARHVSWSDPLALPVVMTVLVAVAGSGTVVMRTRSQHRLTTTAPAVLAAVLVLPPGWAIICTAVGYAMAKAIGRRPPRKAAFNTAKETLAAAAAAAAAQAFGLVPTSVAAEPMSSAWSTYLLGLCAAAAAYAAVDEIVPPPVIALATRTSWWQVYRRDLDIRTITRLVDVAIAAAAVVLAVLDLRLLVLIPAVLVVTYLAYVYRLRLREERRAWQQLAAATDALAAASGTGDLTRVLRTAVELVAELVPAVDVEISTGGRVVRGDQGGIGYDGPAEQAPPATLPATELTLAAPGDEPAGTLRLRFRHGPATLADREPHLLQTLAPHLATAIRNTAAYATVASLAERNAHEATHDPLTNLPNLRSLHEHLAALLNQPTRGHLVAVMLIDLDRFKVVNDIFGHPAGDRVLVEAARRLHAAARDSLVARYGGDEFAVVLHEPTARKATRHAEQLLAELRGPTNIDGVPTNLDASGGLAFAVTGVDEGELLRRADVALYQAKDRTVPIRLAVYQQNHPDLAVRPRAEGSQAEATEAWDLMYQPVVDLATGQVVAAEALPSWQHRDPARTSPQYLPSTRQQPALHNRLVHATLDRALAAAAAWHEGGFAVAVKVNVAPRSLADHRFPTVVRAKLDHHGLDPRLLVIELSQIAALGHTPPVDQTLATLRSAGVRIALDGLGTGHATPADLHRLPIDELQIDGGYVADLPTSAKAAALVGSIVELGRRFALPVTAGGLEHPQQRQMLWELGCAHGQGRLFGPAQTDTELLATLQRGYDHKPGTLCSPLHTDARVIRLPTRPVPLGTS